VSVDGFFHLAVLFDDLVTKLFYSCLDARNEGIDELSLDFEVFPFLVELPVGAKDQLH
jgi:hypothetical protein